MGASFNSIDMGVVFYMNTTPNPNARQINAYAGAIGLEILDQGGRGGTTVASGGLVASNQQGVAALEQQFRSILTDGGGYTLIDTAGTSWYPVILTSFRPNGPYRPTVGGGCCRRYDAEFLHQS